MSDFEGTEREDEFYRLSSGLSSDLTPQEKNLLLIHMGHKKQLIEQIFPCDPHGHDAELISREDMERGATNALLELAKWPPDEARKYLKNLFANQPLSPPTHDVVEMLEAQIMELADRAADSYMRAHPNESGNDVPRDDYLKVMMDHVDYEKTLIGGGRWADDVDGIGRK